MKKLLRLALLMAAGLTGCDSSSSAPLKRFEGVGSSGGGIGVLCGTKLQTLDLFEAQYLHHLTLENPKPDFDQNWIMIGRRFMDYFSIESSSSDEQMLTEVRQILLSKIREVAPGTLTLSQDATLPEIPASCRFVQIALYDDTQDVIFMDPTLWALLPHQEQAALISHESLYKTARQYKTRTSDETRRVIGLLFSTTPLPPLFDDVKHQRLIHCMSPWVVHGNGTENTTNYAHWVSFAESYESGVSGLRGYYYLLDGVYLLSRATTFIPGLSIDSALAGGIPAMQVQVDQPLINRHWTVEYQPRPLADPTMAGLGFELNSRSALTGSALPESSEPLVCLPNYSKSKVNRQ